MEITIPVSRFECVSGLSVYPVCVCTGQSSHSERASAEWQSSAVNPQFNPSCSHYQLFQNWAGRYAALPSR